MFERYTEKARRVIFFSRYEASQFGSPYIESEHLLLGLLRENKVLTDRFMRQPDSVEKIRKKIESSTHFREKVSTSVDLPLTNECKRILAYAAEEAERASQEHIGTEHMLAGVLREEKCFAAVLLREHGVDLKAVREEIRSGVLHMIDAGGGGGGFVATSGARVRHGWTSIELYCGDEKLGDAAMPSLPSVGEYVLLKKEGIDKRYRVREVTYQLEKPPAINREFPYIGRGVVIDLEPA